uniref:Transcription repressor n=1 Tax=Arundo donax TaxID=35708 RepID=A0A0A9FS19_ARUDO
MDKSRHSKPAGDVGVGGRLRQRLAQILLHSSCATTSATAFVGLAKTNAAAAAITNVASRQEPPAPAKLNGGCHRRRRRRSSRALVHISIDCSVGAAALLPAPVPAKKDVTAVRSRRSELIKSNGNRPRPLSHGWSSSTDTDGEVGPFSSDDGGERRRAEADTRSSTLFSSLSFSSDSTSDFYNTTGTGTRSRRHKKSPRRAPARGADEFRPSSVPAACKHKKETKKTKDGAVAAGGSMAVVKRSHNPYADFRRSMMEMVAGRGICGADELSELLVWYLSLNSPRHHPAILAAFEDVWEAVLGTDP